MNIEDVKKRVAYIESISGDDHSAHSEEDQLLLDFVRYVAEYGHDPLSAIATEVLKVDDIVFHRWCA